MAQRPLFDPGKMKVKREAGANGADAPKPAGSSAQAGTSQTISVSQLAEQIDRALQAGFSAPVRVIGEVSGFRERTHWYFDLKDANAVVNCVVFASSARKIAFTPEIGQQVVARGRLEFYAKGGKVTLIIDALEPVGAGALELAYRKLCEELRGLGYFAPERKRALPKFPRRVAVITSRTGAALQDVLDTMRKRCCAIDVLVVDARVQGDGAAAEIAAAIGRVGANAEAWKIDAILLTRGGGSMEDLWAFNERVVADAVLHCPIPIVAAIGHETDVTIAELVADERAATPTQAAMRVTPDAGALLRQLDALRKRLAINIEKRVIHERERVRSAARHALFANPRAIVAQARARVDGFDDVLRRAMTTTLREAFHELTRVRTRLDALKPSTLHAKTLARLDTLEERLCCEINASTRARRAKLEALARQLEVVGPHAVLARGYSLTLKADGSVVRSVGVVKPGEALSTVLPDGRVKSVVEGTGGSVLPPRPVLPRASRSQRKPAPEQGPTLFG